MGLDVTVGILSGTDPDGDEIGDWRSTFNELNKLLLARNLKAHEEPDSCPSKDFDMYGYSGIHYLRRIAAHLEMHGELPAPGPQDSSQLPDGDGSPVKNYYLSHNDSRKKRTFLTAIFKPKPKTRSFDHLMIHSDAEGFYIPQEFENVIIAEPPYKVQGEMVGSSHKLRDECARLAAALELSLDLDPGSDEVFEATENQGKGDLKWKRYAIESMTCLQLFQAADHSVKTGAAIVFT